jgi:TFIIF-interacting CTD phosphatase-like protein
VSFSDKKAQPVNPYLIARPVGLTEIPAESRNQLLKNTNELNINSHPLDNIAVDCFYSAVANSAYVNNSRIKLPPKFADYMKSSRVEYTKALRLLRQLKEVSSNGNNAPEPYYMNTRYSRLKTLMLDMDETLIHSEEFDNAKSQRGHPKQYDFVIEMQTNNKKQKIGVYIRPHCVQFLKKMS